ncbi:MAG: sulfatase-like hydrolase/transferase [Planctomycetaceae bacterium]
MKAIVLTFDCLPLRLLGCYGNQNIETPHFDRSAANAIVLDAHFGENFDASASSHAWWTGRYQFPRSPKQQRGQESLGRMLSEVGVALQMISERSATTPGADLQKGWHTTAVGSASRAGADPTQTHFGRLVDEAQKHFEGMAANTGASQLLWLRATGFDLSDTQQDSETALAAFARGITTIDRELGRLLEIMAEYVNPADLLFILTSSQGADLGERAGRNSPSIQLSEGVVHVPLIVRLPNGEMGSRRACLTQSVDIVPTLLEWFGVDAARHALEGRSLLPTVFGTAIDEREHVCLGIGDRERAIRTRDFYLVEHCSHREPGDAATENDQQGSDTAYLFKKPDDRFDIHNVAQQFPGVCEQLRRSLEGFAAQFGPPAAG